MSALEISLLMQELEVTPDSRFGNLNFQGKISQGCKPFGGYQI
jgi:hypothetical protein